MKQKLATMTEFRTSVDLWIKEINGKVAAVQEINPVLSESKNNIEHNYELIYELKDQIEDLKSEIKKLKLLHLLSMKKKISVKN
ncbi:MAG: hypothetical protein QGH47_06375 [Candidatus Woesearchaeota archaeon]|jgi:peptidoglycan hydrolase CwlO-like protein|nr:hypothetical protein [Candidatus Woesearchaeota archaeon]